MPGDRSMTSLQYTITKMSQGSNHCFPGSSTRYIQLVTPSVVVSAVSTATII